MASNRGNEEGVELWNTSDSVLEGNLTCRVGEQAAIGREEPGRMQSAGPGEHPLRLAQPVRQPGEHPRGHPHRVGGHVIAGPDPDRVDTVLTADAAGAAGQEVPAQPGIGQRDAGAQRDVGDVIVAHFDRRDIRR